MKNLFLLLSVLLIAACKTNSSVDSAKTDLSPKNLVKIDLKVGGMTCTGCENTISKAVASLNGVKECTASHTDSLAQVTYDSTLVSLDQISNKISEVGYSVLRKVQGTIKME